MLPFKIFTSFLMLSTCAFSGINDDIFYDDNDFIISAQGSDLQSPYQEKTPLKSAAKAPAPTQKKVKKNANHFMLQGEAMILNAGLNNLEYGDTVEFLNQVETHNLASCPRPYNVGLRIMAAAHLHALDWDLQADVFHYGNKSKQTLNKKANNLLYLTYSSDINNSEPQNVAGGYQTGQYQINLNIADLLLSKKVLFQKHYAFVLDTGFRFLNIKQRLNVTNSTTDSVLSLNTYDNNIRNTDGLNAYGLMLKIHNQFFFTKQLCLDLSGAISCVYGQQKMTNTAIDNKLDLFDLFYGASFTQYNHKVLPVIEFEAKLGYQVNFFEDSVALVLSAGYFLMDLINGFEGVKVSYAELLHVQTTSRYSADTVLQGASAGLGLKF
jgi:hypothetical protein